jgi:2-succinyl-6-hydroxy-2,4-cyclohexadiene-1-carboxylate synthase
VTAVAEQLDIDAGDGLVLHVARSGNGAPVLLLHGFTGSSTTWDALRNELQASFTIITVDLPGHGRSGTPTDPARYALSRFSDDLTKVLDALAVERVALLGYSMGGRTALDFTLRHPNRVAALVLESTSPGIADPGERAARIASDIALADRIERDGVASFVDEWERLPLWASQRSLPEETRARLRTQRLTNQSAGLANSLRGAGAGAEPPVTGRLADIAVPILSIAGALDSKYVALARLIGASTTPTDVAVVTGAGHAVHLEQPDEFLGLVVRFLNRVSSEAGAWREAHDETGTVEGAPSPVARRR